MLKPPKSVVGRVLKKIVALLMAYCFLATSAWSLNPPGQGLRKLTSFSWASLVPIRSLLSLAPAAGKYHSDSGSDHAMPVPKIFTNLAELHASMAAAAPPTAGTSSSISSNFNATPIPAGDIIWFTAVLKLNGAVPASPVSISVENSAIQFTAGTTNYSLNPANAVITFSPRTTTTTATFDTANNATPVWLQNQLNPQPSGNTLLQAFAFPVPAGGLPGGIKNVTWTNTFSSDTANISLNWQWAAAVYTGCVNTTYSSDDVKPTDDNAASIYKNSDHAGTPEACKSSVAQGATGGGASNYTGSLSGTASVTPPVASASPVITTAINPPPNSNGWNNTNVTVTFSCSDANFAIATCPAPVTVSSEGAGQVISGTAVDQAGGSVTAKASVTVNLDKTSPSIVASATSSSGGGGGVLTLPVTVAFTCADTGSGVASCPTPVQVTTPGANEVFSGTATDKAGNTATTSIALNTESSPLAITATLSPIPVNGWNKTSVGITYQCTGGVPPVHCPQSQTVSTEGAGQVISAIATDAAGQSSTFPVTLNIDETPPTISATSTPTANAAGWNTSDVTISYICSDTLSGVVLCPAPQVVSTEGKAQQISASVNDKAGNTTPITTTINLEKTAPSITAALSPVPNAAGWNKSDVTVNFTCTPSVSDIVSCPPPVSVTTEGKAQEISGTVTDQAGKSNTATVPVSLDKTPPSIAIGAPVTIVNNHASLTVTYSDAGSGIDVSTFSLLIDGIDHTAEFTTTATGASGSTLNVLTSGSHVITASIADLAGNTNSATAPFTIQAVPLTISITQPVSGTYTNANSITVSGTVTGVSPIAVTVEGTNATVQGNTFSADVALGAGPSQILHVSANDAVGSSGSATVTVSIDRVPPTIVGSISPLPNAANWNNTGVIVSFVCADDNSGVASCTGPMPLTGEGAHQVVTGTAVDKAGNTASTSVTVNIDKTPPLITATSAPPANANGWNNSNVNVTFICTDSLSGVASCPPATLVTTEGQNQQIPGQAVDNAGNVTPIGITLSIDKTPPTIVQLSTPDHISALHGGQVTATVTDNFTVSQVVISVNGNSLGTFTTPPYQANLQVPAGVSPGDTLTVTVVATDEAGNTQTSSRGVSVTADGVIVGQVLSDATGLPVSGAAVQLISTAGQIDQTDPKGRYSFQASDAHLFLSATSSGTTTVQREIFVQPGAGTVAVDARLTPLAAPVPVGSAGGTLTAGPVSISVPAAVVSDGTTFQLTPLSGQGLPGLLPLGWSPLAAFDLRTSASVSQLPAVVSQLPGVVMHLAIYDPALHAWTLVASNLQSVNGACSFTVPAPGAYALVLPDTTTPPIPIPDPGSPLTGIAVAAIDPAASSSGSLNPAMLPPAGGTATATLGLQSPSFAPSGTIVQANVSETFSLASGDVVSEETRSEDILLYNGLAPANSAMGAQFAVTPSHQYTIQQLVTGKIHLDILAGREGIRGQPGGNDPLTIGDGIATLSVPGGALGQDTAISVQSTSLENFVPTSSSMGAIQEVLVDFSGEILNTPAQLSISANGLNPGDTFLLTQVQRINGVPHMVAVALAQISGTTLSSVASPGLPGVTQGGEYVFYDISVPVGFVQGVTSSTAGPVPALVLTDSLQIASISGGDGHYTVPAMAGTANLKASSPNTSLAGTASAQVIAGQTVAVNILLAGIVTSATVTPADGTLGVSPGTIITITTTAPLNPQSIVQSNLSLVQGPASTPGAPVPLQPFVLSTSGTTLTFAPVANLAPATQYTIRVSGLADASGGAVAVPTSSFTTKASAPLNFDPNAITFAMPDQNGNIHVSAPAGSLPPGTQVLIVDQGNAVVFSLTALNDGSLSGDFPGTINDVLQVTVTSPNGATTTFTRSQFVAADGSVAVGAGGGTVTGPGGVELRIPAGALDKGATFKIESVGPDIFPERPDLTGATFGSGLKISSPDQPTFKQEVRLAFPMPTGAPPGAFFQVYRKLIGSNNQYAFEDVDYAKVEAATGKVVTASFPYRGLIDLNVQLSDALFGGQQLGGALGGSAVGGVLDNVAILMWTFDQLLPGVALGGAITGRVRYAVPPGGTEPNGTINKTGDTVFGGVPNITVRVDTNTSTHALGSGQTVATTQPDGTFTFSDPNYHGGTINLVASDGAGHSATASAIEVVSVTDLTVEQFAGPLLPLYRNVAFADMVVPAPAPPPPTPKIAISFFTENPNSTPPGLRVAAAGIIASGTPLVIAFKTNGQITNPPSVRINNTSFATQADQPTVQGDPNTQDFELSQPFTPGAPGIYTLTVTGLTPFLQTITASKSFLVIAPGGNNNTIKVGTPPIIASVNPLAGSIGVPLNTLVQVQFSEPVTNLPGHVSLATDDGSPSPSLKLSGIDYRDGVTVISNLSSTDGVASMTIEPSELKYGTHYTLQITSDVVDLDNVADPTKPALQLVQPQNQTPPQVPYDFFTFGPTPLGSIGTFSSTRPVVFGNRAYVAVPKVGVFSELDTYDVSDPTQPKLLPTAIASFAGRPMDLAGEQTAPVNNNGALIAIGTGFATSEFPLPSNLWLYDVSTDQITRIGGISVTSSCVNVGQILRLTLHGNFAYTSTYPIGINVVDLAQGISEYKSADPTTFGVMATTDGEGFANDAVVNTIPVQDATGRNVMILGIQASDYLVAGSDPQNPITQTLVVATGRANGLPIPNPTSFVVADPTQSGPSATLYNGQLQLAPFSLTAGLALAVGQITINDANGNPVPKPIAVVVGSGVGPDPTNPGATTSSVMAVVDMSVPSAPAVLSIQGLSGAATDVLLNNNMAIVGENANSEMFDLTDPTHPFQAGSINGVGGLLALNGFLYSSSFFGTGLHIAALGALAFVKSFDPPIIVVSPANQLFDNVNIKYGVIPPDPSITTAEVHIDAQNGNRAATLPGPVSAGNGSVTWPSGAVVSPSNAYFATVHASMNGAELPTTQVRVPLVGVPIAVAPRDRMLRIQFALPDQKLFVDSLGNPIDKYTVKVYLNGDGSGSPAFLVTSTDIANAYVNTDAWFSTTPDGTGVPIQDGSTQGVQAWVTRKIDKFSVPIGLNSPIRMQAFEIGTVLGQPTPIFIKVVSEKTGNLVAKLPATPSADGNWSQIIDQVAGYVDENPTPSQQLIAGILDNAGMIFRVLDILDQASTEFNFGVLQGLVDGFKDGAAGDANMVGSIFDAVRHPVKTAQALYQFVGKVITSLKQVSFSQIVDSLFSNASWPTLNQAVLLAGKAGYFLGYLCGFILEQVLSAVILALISEGVGALAEKVLVLLRGVTWLTQLATDAMAVLRVMGYWMEVLATAAADSTTAKAVLGFLRDSKAAIVALTEKYPAADKVLKKLASVWQVSSAFASEAFGWLNIVNKMTNDTAERLVTFLLNKGQTDSEALMARWLGLANGKRSVADAADAYTGFSNLTEGASDALVSAAETVDTDTIKYTKQYGTKYAAASDGDRVGSSLAQMRAAPADGKYTDEAIGDAVKLNSDPAVVEMSNDAIEETAAIESHVGCTLVASLVLSVLIPQPCGKAVVEDWYQAFGADTADMGPQLKKGLEQLKALNDPQLETTVSNIANAARINPAMRESVVRAMGTDALTTQQKAEYFTSFDKMQQNGSYITGALDAAPTAGSSANITNVGNKTGSSIALGHAYEPVAMRRMIEGPVEQWNSLTQQWEQVKVNVSVNDISQMGPKVDLSGLPNAPQSTIEKDFEVLNGISVDMKHSVTSTPSLDSTQLAAVEAAIKGGRIPGQWYVGAGRFSAGDVANVAAANARISAALGPGTPDLIRLFNAGPY